MSTGKPTTGPCCIVYLSVGFCRQYGTICALGSCDHAETLYALVASPAAVAPAAPADQGPAGPHTTRVSVPICPDT
jgi:hypothetical protein